MDESNRRIARNTIYLYLRQFVVVIVAFYTTRIVLEKLGASDYGINNIVYGFVSLFAVLNSILSGSSRRFLSLYLGKGDSEELRLVFATSMLLHVAIAVIIGLALETYGLWFLNTDLNIPPDRMVAANWLFQFAVITTIVGIIQAPLDATVTAHEKFNVYAWLSIYGVVSKLVVIFLLVYIPGDKLIIYGILNLIVSLSCTAIYAVYCYRQFEECVVSRNISRSIMKEMLRFSGWGAFGNVIQIINSQGISIILNIFFNTVMNAARGLASTVNSAISTFIGGFTIASQPQIVKYYGSGQMDKFQRLIFNSSLYSLFIIAIVMAPVLLEIDYVVKLWLGNDVPMYTTSFIRITMVCTIVYSSSSLIDFGLNAIGRVRELNCYSSPLYLLTVPLSYFALKMHMSPTIVYWIAAVPAFISFVVNLLLLSKYVGFEGWRFFRVVFLKTILLIAVSMILPYFLQMHMKEGFERFVLVSSFSVFCTGGVLFYWGVNRHVRELIINKFKKLIVR